MSEDKKGDRGIHKVKRRIGRYWFGIFVVAPVVVVGGLAWRTILLHLRPVDAQLAAIEAARAIPESEDAGAAYIKLAGEYLPLPRDPPVVDGQAVGLTISQPWSRKDRPKLAVWLDERQDLVSKLLDISKMEQCRLPIPLEGRQMSRSSNPVRHMRGWAYLLVRSANNDVAEGRLEAAIEKYVCVLQMSDHLRQQPVLSYFNNGLAHELSSLTAICAVVARTGLDEKQLTVLEAALMPAGDDWKKCSRTAVRVQRLLGRRGQPRLTNWRRHWEYRKFTSKTDADALERTRNLYLSVLTKRRQMHILIALRRFKNKTGQWPRSLDLIEPPLSKETLTDPRSNTPFVYELAGESFRLHSKGAD